LSKKKVETTLGKKKQIFPKFSKLEKNWTQIALIFFADFFYLLKIWRIFPHSSQKKKSQLSYISKFFSKTFCKIEKNSPKKKMVEAILPKAAFLFSRNFAKFRP